MHSSSAARWPCSLPRSPATVSPGRHCARSKRCDDGPRHLGVVTRPPAPGPAEQRRGVTARGQLNEMLARIGDGLARERRFVADPSRELRTPLALIKTELELALRRSRSTEELEAAIRGAAENTERLSRIADDRCCLPGPSRDAFPRSRARRRRGRLRDSRRTLSLARRVGATGHICGGGRSPCRLGRPLAPGAGAREHGRQRVHSRCRPRQSQDEQRNGSTELHVLDEGNGFSARLPSPCLRALQPGAENDSPRKRPRPGNRRDNKQSPQESGSTRRDEHGGGTERLARPAC